MRDLLVSYRRVSVLMAAACSAIVSYAQCGPFGCPPCFSNAFVYYNTSGGTQNGVTVINVGIVPCGPSGCTTTEYKSGTRKYISSLGNTIVADFGDQYSDLLGGDAGHQVKLPNPMYYLP